jgi:hypothetical protein
MGRVKGGDLHDVALDACLRIDLGLEVEEAVFRACQDLNRDRGSHCELYIYLGIFARGVSKVRANEARCKLAKVKEEQKEKNHVLKRQDESGSKFSSICRVVQIAMNSNFRLLIAPLSQTVFSAA